MDPIQTPEPGTEPIVEPVALQQPTEPAAPAVDYEKKFSESTRENQILSAKLAEATGRKGELTKEPTDSDLRAAFPHLDFDLMDPVQKESLRTSFTAKRIAEGLAVESQADKAEKSWNTSLEMAIESNPELSGRERDFKAFANKSTHKGAPVNVLVSAFLHESTSSAPNSAPTPRPGLETGTGGPKEPEKPKTLSGAELKQLRETNYRAYLEYCKTHDVILD